MLGKKEFRGKLFYQFNLEVRVPADHLLRRVAQAAEFSLVRRLTRRFCSHTGRPSIDPIAFFKIPSTQYPRYCYSADR